MSATLMDVRAGGVERRAESFRNRPLRMHGRILVADDSADGRRTIADMLASMGLSVDLAENGRAAFKMALAASKAGHPFDLVLMDADMPEIDGYETTALLRSVGYPGRIVAVTGCGFTSVHDKHLAAGCDGYASKPITFAMLRDTVRRYL